MLMSIRIAGRIAGFCLGLLTLNACGPALLVAGGATAAAVVVQDRTPGSAISDAALQVEIERRLLQADETLFGKVNLEIVDGRVMIVGIVPTQADRITVSKVVWQTPDVAEVINELQVSEQGRMASFGTDTWISTQLRTALIRDPNVRRLNYNIETVNSTVYLIGIARSAAELDLVKAHAKTIGGVNKVVSHVTIRDLSS